MQYGRLDLVPGLIVLALGIAGAGIVYWLGTRSPDLSDDLSMVGYNKPETRQMEILYGKEGDLIEDWSNDLKQPGTQAVIIVLAAALVDFEDAAAVFAWVEVEGVLLAEAAFLVASLV